ncbi:MAG: ATP-binding cassette domain-containing protein [Desulfurococcales archaeon]|nr:ATP-binding cassette domain-containing protein [Desulfurococcales archaeon]
MKYLDVDIKEVRKDGDVILAGIDFTASAGEKVLLHGPSGSGKSTLLKVISGLIPELYQHFEVSGTVRVAGLTPAEAAEQGIISYVPQDPSTFFIGLSLNQEFAILSLESGRRLMGLGCLDPSKSFLSMSDGEMYRAASMISVYSGAKVLLFDEPSAHLDPSSLRGFLDVLDDVCEEGVTVVIADTRQEPYRGYVDKVVSMGSDPFSQERVSRRTRSVGDEVAFLARDVRFRYAEGFELSGFDVEVKVGESLAFLGRNGVGKTTRLKLLAGILKPVEGFVKTAEPVFYLPQSPLYMFSEGTVIEELRLHARLWGWNRSVEDVAEALGLLNILHRNPYTLSVGEARRLMLALGIIHNPRGVILDEPTLGMGGGARCLVAELVEELLSSGKSVVIGTHDPMWCDVVDAVHELR